jgi:membrane protein DedA with SNARE-associated domain
VGHRPADDPRERLHPDPVGGDDAVRRLQRVRGAVLGTFANLVGSWIAYAVGYYGRLELLEKHGKYLHIKPSHLQWADRWFAQYGSYAVFFSRMLPIIRTFISLPAGVARMPFWKFSVLTFLGALPWVFLFCFIGKQVGANWEDWKDKLHYVDYAMAVLILAAIAYLVVRWWRGRRARTATDVA